MKIIAIIGSIGSGKTTVANIFKKLFKVNIISSDLCNKIIMKQKFVIYSLKRIFSSEIFIKSNVINYSIFKKKVMYNSKNKILVQNLMHPLIRKEINNRLYCISKNPSFYSIIEIPLLNKYKLLNYYSYIDKVINIKSIFKNKINRLKIRDNNTKILSEKILSLQIDDEERDTFSDFVIYNNSSIKDLYIQVKNLHNYLY